MKELRGHGVALITPFKTNGAIDFDAIPGIIKHLINGGVDYLVVLGTTAESTSLSNDEKKQLIAAIVNHNAGILPLVIGIGGNNTQQVFEDLVSFDLSPFSAVLSVTPYYNKPNQEGLYSHFRAIAENSSLPVILYNVPSRTGVNLEPETVLRLAKDFDKIVAIKEAAGDFQQAQILLKICPNNFLVLSGDDEMSLPMLLAGAKGVISVIGNALPEVYSRIVQNGIDGDANKGYQTQYQILDLIRTIYDEGNPTGIKVLMNALGLCENQLRLPLVTASESLYNKLNKYIKEYI
ncbi:MAG: 4-hydroxy-tetrahydrodipicolinate synthase [Flavobacteriales bacterium TMED235]|nr:MAG: 4-hydroxy-tetrahydrodipicolinate synthase [Flavobacteriales bacterium TMED235]|tara:strand:+ start:2137 stop:3015 length:879 start_codon:yes stop_codon:yes gene_type:complete